MLEARDRRLLAGREYIGVDECVDKNGHVRRGIVLESSTHVVVAQIFEGTSGLTLPDTRIRFCGEPLTISVSKEMLGRVFNGLGLPIDGGPPQPGDIELDVKTGGLRSRAISSWTSTAWPSIPRRGSIRVTSSRRASR